MSFILGEIIVVVRLCVAGCGIGGRVDAWHGVGRIESWD